MAILNRDKDPSEQKENVNVALGSMATGVTRHAFVIPYPCNIELIRASAQGVSNAMQLAFELIRGAGSSGFPMGISNMVLQNRSTYGVVSYSGLAAPGSTLLAAAQGDVLQVISSVSNGNATDLSLSIILKKTQDYVSYWGN